MKFSVVTSLYNSEKLINEFYQRISAVMQSLNEEYEIILVNDGSSDETLKLAKSIQQKDHRVILVDFAKNFGFPEALYCGLKIASGDYIFVIDSDLEEPPEVFHQFWDTLKSNTNLESVYGVQPSRKGGWFERWSGDAFYLFVDIVFPNRYSRNVLAVRLFTKEYKERVLSYHSLISDIWIGFVRASEKQQPIVIKKGHKGWTTFHFRVKLITAIKILTDLSIMAAFDGLNRRNSSFFKKLTSSFETLALKRRSSKLYHIKNIHRLEK